MKYDASYARQSLFKKDSLSITGQQELCQKAATETLVTYEDAGYSGKNTKRPAFQKLIADIKADKIRRLYVYRLDRFSRSVADFGQLWDILNAHSVEFVSVSENFDTTTPMGRAMLHIIMVFAQLERETTAERVKDNYYRRSSLGAWPGGPAPYGFDIGKSRTLDGKKISTLIPNEKAAVTLHIFEEYAQEGMSLSQLARKLTKDGIPGPKRKTWDNVTLSRILHNPVYAMADEQIRLYLLGKGCNVSSNAENFDGLHGVMLIGKRKSSDRKYTTIQDHNAFILSSVGFVPSKLWLQCQTKLDRNKQVGNSGKGTYTWLTGLLKCAQCGYSLKVSREDPFRWLVCSGRYNVSACDATIRAKLDNLESCVAAEIDRMLMACQTEEEQLDEVDTSSEVLQELERRADRLMAAFAESDDLPRAYLQRALRQIEEERQELIASQRRDGRKNPVPKRIRFQALDFEEKKVVATQFIRRIEVKDDCAEVIWAV